MVELSYLAIGGIALAAMFFGYAFGLFEGRSQGYKKRQKEEATEKKDQPVVEVVQPAPEPQIVKVDDPGLLRIKSESGYITLDLDGNRVDTSSLTAEQRKRLIEMLNLMRPWLEGKPVAVPAMPTPVSQSQPNPVPAPPPTSSSTSASIAPLPTASQPVPSRPATIAKEDRPVAPAGSIVSQIDSILQARLAGTPLADRGIFLAQSAEGGVMVYVGLSKYTGIDEVPDPEIKTAIRSAIQEWENKYTPGL